MKRSNSAFSTEEVQARLSQKETVEQLIGATRRWTPVLNKRVLIAAMLGLSATGVACGYSAYRIDQSEKDFQALQRAHINSVASQMLNGIQRQLETSVSSTKALSALIHLDEGRSLMEPLGSEVGQLRESCQTVAALADAPEEVKQAALEAKKAVQQQIVMNSSRLNFNIVAESLITSYKGISNLQLAPAGVVSVIHPIEGNQGAVGHDLFFDPSRNADAKSAIALGRTIFIGPVQNGKLAIIARNPTFINRPGFVGTLPEYPSWWGFTTMVCALDDLFASTPLASAVPLEVSYLLYAVTSSGIKFLHSSPDVAGRDGDITGSLAHAAGQAPSMVEFTLPELNVHWVMLVWPQGGWRARSGTFVWQVMLCATFAVCSLVSMYSVMVRETVIQEVEGILRPSPAREGLPLASSSVAWGERRQPPVAANCLPPMEAVPVVPL